MEVILGMQSDGPLVASEESVYWLRQPNVTPATDPPIRFPPIRSTHMLYPS
jgi:hypothetical protein